MEPGCFTQEIVYENKISQIENIIELSAECTQKIGNGYFEKIRELLY